MLVYHAQKGLSSDMEIKISISIELNSKSKKRRKTRKLSLKWIGRLIAFLGAAITYRIV